MDATKVIEKLNDILRHEWTGVAQYSQAGFLVQGMWREVYSGLFFENASESFGHAKKIGEKIVAMGGVPTAERNPIKQTQNLDEMLENALEFEATAVKQYTEALALTDDDRALTVFLEDILVEEQEGVDHMTQLLRDHPGTGGQSATKAG